MPVWPFIMAIVVGLFLWGLRHNAWIAPAVVFAGYVGVRLIVSTIPADYSALFLGVEFGAQEIAISLWWICVCCYLASIPVYLPAFFYALSAITYPALSLLGYRLEYMGLTAVIAEVFAICALISIGADINGKSGRSSLHSDTGGSVDRHLVLEDNLAKGSPSTSETPKRRGEVANG